MLKVGRSGRALIQNGGTIPLKDFSFIKLSRDVIIRHHLYWVHWRMWNIDCETHACVFVVDVNVQILIQNKVADC